MSKFDYKNIGNFLKSERRKRDLTFREFAKILGFNPVRYSELEKGNPWSIYEIKLVANELGVSFDFMYDLLTKQEPPCKT